MDDQIIKNLKELAQSNIVDSLVKDSLSEIKFTRKNIVQYLISLFGAMVLSYGIIFMVNPVEGMQSAVEIINNVSLAFIAIIFGTYALFQALMTDSVVWALLKDKENLLCVSNKSFLHWILLYFTEIITNTVILIILSFLPREFVLFGEKGLSNVLAYALCLVYFFYSLLILYEMKNFALNIYRMFSVYNIYHSLQILEERKNHDDMQE